jgi:hypothetical protein
MQSPRAGLRHWWTLDVEEAHMRRLNDYRFYELGTKLQPLQNMDGKTVYKDMLYELWFARAPTYKTHHAVV